MHNSGFSQLLVKRELSGLRKGTLLSRPALGSDTQKKPCCSILSSQKWVFTVHFSRVLQSQYLDLRFK